MSESMIIGVDHGYAAMKTAHFSFPSGLVAYEHEPYTLKDVLEYGGKFYVVGSGRQALQKNKTQTEDYYLLTLAAIAKELSFRHAEPAAEIHLAAGLPLTSFGREKNAFRDYLLRDGRTVSFRYEGQEYSITIRKVSLFPQGYAAVLTQSILLDEPSVIVADIGGWTVDLMRLDNRIPNASTCRSLELGMIRCLDEIGEQIRRALGLSMTATQMESVLRGDAVHINEDARKIIDRQADAYVHRLLSAITESGLDTRAMPAVFLGGGALLKRGMYPLRTAFAAQSSLTMCPSTPKAMSGWQSGSQRTMSSNKKRINLSFSMSSPIQRRAWKKLTEIPAGQRTAAVCRMVCEYKGQQELLDAVRQTIRQELRGVQLTKEEAQDSGRAGDVDESVLGFLLALQEGDEMT